VRGRHYCVAHSRAEEQDAPAPSAPGGPPGPDHEALWEFLREARAAELNFVARFRANAESRDSLPEPDGGKTFAVKRWDEVRAVSDRAARMKRLLPEPRRLADVRALCPVNLVCRYTFRRPALLLEARCAADLAALAQAGRDAPPLSLDALLQAIHERAAEAQGSRCQVVAALFSVAGWDPSCVAQVVGDASRPALVHPEVSVCLVGPELAQIHANPTDRRLQAYLPLFRGETLAEAAAGCKQAMFEELLARDRVFVKTYARDHGIGERAALLAAHDLSRERDNVDLVDVKDVGPALKWRK
jgi:hypothetical protein